MAKPPKPKMATSREIINRILWDRRLNPDAFAIGYLDRTSSAICEMPLAKWDANGDIPWHRIRYIRCGDTMVWDRDEHLDLFATGELPAAAQAGNLRLELPAVVALNPIPSFGQRPVYRYGLQGWQQLEETPSITLDAIAVATWNVLCDSYESERIQTSVRLSAIAESLRLCNADIIALQEVTPPLLNLLLAQSWTQQYFISEPPEGTTLQPHGIVILSRYPFALAEYQYSRHKRVLVGTWRINGRSLQVAAVHLTSDRAAGAAEIRARQLSLLLDYLKAQPGDSLIVGDFNARGDEQQQILSQNGSIDVWQALHLSEAGYTFDPDRNPLAALMSLSGKAARFDRILLRSQEEHWQPRSINLFGCEPIAETQGTLYPSDHFGVHAVLTAAPSRAKLSTPRPIYQSAIVIIPPTELWPAIQAIRHRYDRSFHRWMPHINLLYGFLPEEHFQEAASAIAIALAKVQPFEIALDILCLVPAKVSGVGFLTEVQERLQGFCERSRVVEDAKVPVLRMQIEGVSVDLVSANAASQLDAIELPPASARRFFEPASWRAIVGCLESDAIAGGDRVSLESLREMMLAVRSWAKARQIYGNAWGFLGSFSWTLLAAISCASYPTDRIASLEMLLTHFFQFLNQQDWSQPLALTETGKRYKVRESRDWLPIITSIAPCQNSARNVTRSTAQILRREFERGSVITREVLAGNADWEELFEAVDWRSQSEIFLRVTAVSKNRDSLEICCGWLEGNIVGLILDLELQFDAAIRPLPGINKRENQAEVTLGLTIFQGLDCIEIENIAQNFVQQFNAFTADLDSIYWKISVGNCLDFSQPHLF